MKRKNSIRLHLSGDDADRNVRVTLTQQDKGYYLGDLSILGASYHVEAIQMKHARPSADAIDRSIETECALNPTYQNRLDCYSDSNEGHVPELVVVGRRVFFINIEAYAI
jgi:hypothetical protein